MDARPYINGPSHDSEPGRQIPSYAGKTDSYRPLPAAAPIPAPPAPLPLSQSYYSGVSIKKDDNLSESNSDAGENKSNSQTPQNDSETIPPNCTLYTIVESRLGSFGVDPRLQNGKSVFQSIDKQFEIVRLPPPHVTDWALLSPFPGKVDVAEIREETWHTPLERLNRWNFIKRGVIESDAWVKGCKKLYVVGIPRALSTDRIFKILVDIFGRAVEKQMSYTVPHSNAADIGLAQVIPVFGDIRKSLNALPSQFATPKACKDKNRLLTCMREKNVYEDVTKQYPFNSNVAPPGIALLQFITEAKAHQFWTVLSSGDSTIYGTTPKFAPDPNEIKCYVEGFAAVSNGDELRSICDIKPPNIDSQPEEEEEEEDSNELDLVFWVPFVTRSTAPALSEALDAIPGVSSEWNSDVCVFETKWTSLHQIKSHLLFFRTFRRGNAAEFTVAALNIAGKLLLVYLKNGDLRFDTKENASKERQTLPKAISPRIELLVKPEVKTVPNIISSPKETPVIENSPPKKPNVPMNNKEDIRAIIPMSDSPKASVTKAPPIKPKSVETREARPVLPKETSEIEIGSRVTPPPKTPTCKKSTMPSRAIEPKVETGKRGKGRPPRPKGRPPLRTKPVPKAQDAEDESSSSGSDVSGEATSSSSSDGEKAVFTWQEGERHSSESVISDGVTPPSSRGSAERKRKGALVRRSARLSKTDSQSSVHLNGADKDADEK